MTDLVRSNLDAVTRERLEMLLDRAITVGLRTGFQFEKSDGSIRLRDSVIAEKWGSFVKGIYSISVWGVRNCHNKAVTLFEEDFLEKNEVGEFLQTELEALGWTKLVIVERMGEEENGESVHIE